MAPIKVGFCGYGYSTRTFHLPFVLSNPRLAVYAFLQRGEKPHTRGKEGSHCLDDFPDAKWYRTAEDFMADPEIELVVIATRTEHAKLAIAALEAGKHVVVEKCFTETSAEADACLAAQKKSGKVLTVFQSRRYDSDYRTLASVVNSPKQPLGEITECEIHYDVDAPGWAVGNKDAEYTPGAGMMFGLGCHTLDQALALFGRPHSVTGFYRALRGIKSKVDDSFTIILQYSGEKENLIVTVKTSVVNKMVLPVKYFVRGRKGTFQKIAEDPQETQIGEGLKPSDKGYGEESPDIYAVLTSVEQYDPGQTKQIGWMEGKEMYVGKIPSLKGSYSDYYEDVVKAILGEGPVVIDPVLVRNNVRICELARQSADEGRTLLMD